ncbi:MAG TPA: hypothetical protein PKO41_01295 [Dokdonella sp.]|uniref:CPBP family glutamic-type intramembrane protease n=1 Tax=Dokdonella sp. TaxID=2291710 RepID=UPI0025BEFF77|nr:CPBP family glutamic-type intramembrane protease [Dokdonella sp.]MBX3692826.1 hypothetical protein [Dokdonella sp.]MCW5567779.1 hypothetical protein [Dokdonella sp.]HNR91036.1 hypothetical protein [Dokdonella sp.]
MNPPATLRALHVPALAAGLLGLLAIIGGSFALDRIARAQMRAHQIDTATRILAALLHGDTPMRWSLNAANDIITGAAIGAAASTVERDGLHVRADDDGFEVGLVLHAPLDLARYAVLELDVDAEAAGKFAVRTQHTRDGPSCISAPMPVVRGVQVLRLDLSTLNWQCDDDSTTPPVRTILLRLRLDPLAGTSVRLANVRLRPASKVDPAALDVLRLDMPIDAFALAVSEHQQASRWRVIELDMQERVEPTLLAMDRIRTVAPAAIIVPQGQYMRVLADARAMPPAAAKSTHRSTVLAWIAVAVLAATLAWVRLRPWPSPGRQAAAELAGTLGVPLALLAIGAIGDDLGAPTLVALGLCVTFAASLLKGDAPRQPATRTWLRGAAIAFASVAVAIAIVVVLRDPAQTWEWPPPQRILRYLGWAALQQFLVTVIVAERIARLTGSTRAAIVLAAFAFALLHAPNAMLMQFTFIGALLWTWNWQRHRALLANTLAHAVSGLVLATGLPPEWLRSAEIGARYFLFGNY